MTFRNSSSAVDSFFFIGFFFSSQPLLLLPSTCLVSSNSFKDINPGYVRFLDNNLLGITLLVIVYVFSLLLFIDSPRIVVTDVLLQQIASNKVPIDIVQNYLFARLLI